MHGVGPDALLVVAIGDRRLGLPPATVAAILPLPALAAPPGLPRPLAGFATLDGRAVPVVATATLFGDPPPETLSLYAHLIRLTDPPLCLLVDRALGFATGGDTRPVDAAHSLDGVVTAIVDDGTGPIHLIDPAHLLLAAERTRIAELTAQAQARITAWDAA